MFLIKQSIWKDLVLKPSAADELGGAARSLAPSQTRELPQMISKITAAEFLFEAINDEMV